MANVYNVTPAWRRRVHTALERCRSGAADFTWINVGDSIATGRVGIDNATQHYTAVAADEIARAAGVGSELFLHTPMGPRPPGTVTWSGPPWPVETARGFFGAGCWRAEVSDGFLQFTPPGKVDIVTVGFDGRGSFESSSDRGRTWRRWGTESSADGAAQVDVPVDPSVGAGLRIRATELGCTVHYLAARCGRRSAVRWFTSGVPGARTPELRCALAAKNATAGTRPPIAASLLTVAIGVNDTIHADEQTKPGSVDALRTVVADLLGQSGSAVALVGAPPVRADHQPGPWRVLEAYRDVYRPVASEFGIPLVEVDEAFSGFGGAVRDGLLADHVHPSVRGHEVIAREWVTTLLGE